MKRYMVRIKSFANALALITLISTVAITTAWAFSDENYGTRQDSGVLTDHESGMFAHSPGMATSSSAPLLHSAMNQVELANRHLRYVQSVGNNVQTASARNLLLNAETMLKGVLAQMTGVSQSSIQSMHNTGLFWVQINSKFGIGGSHSSSLGMHEDDLQDEIMNITMHQPLQHNPDDHYYSLNMGIGPYHENRSSSTYMNNSSPHSGTGWSGNNQHGTAMGGMH